MDMWWNPALEDQAFDRAHRLGQKLDVNIHKLTIGQTVEDRILALQTQKRELAQAALNGSSVKNMKLTMADIMSESNRYCFLYMHLPVARAVPALLRRVERSKRVVLLPARGHCDRSDSGPAVYMYPTLYACTCLLSHAGVFPCLSFLCIVRSTPTGPLEMAAPSVRMLRHSDTLPPAARRWP